MYPADWKDLNRDAKCWDIETDDVRMQKSEVTNSPSLLLPWRVIPKTGNSIYRTFNGATTFQPWKQPHRDTGGDAGC